ncbi:unnamed protein product, partial [Meganyctiphanes norvegica]|uniref:Lysosomal enzyme trafficking factor n=1 Tax=Meganyctiphanes norvegica TaxID=48144 RepID=A0AAV2RWG2_MEGNR
MKVRQRFAWIFLALYLASTCALVYYLLDIADQFAMFSLEHSRLHGVQDQSSSPLKIWHHIGDIPFPLLLLLVAIPYFQIFATLFYCTLPNANSNVNKCLVPILGWIYLFQKVNAIFRVTDDERYEEKTSGHHIVTLS